MGVTWPYEIFIFSFLIVWAFFLGNGKKHFKEKTKEDWFIDLFSLSIQGTLVPLIQTYLLFRILELGLPYYAGSLNLSPFWAFALNFVFVDYMYYLCHKTLHRDGLWGFHLLHHSAPHMDVIVSSRNSFWTTFLLPYLWLNALFLFLLKDKTYYLLSISLTVILDLWRHSEFVSPRKGKVLKTLSFVIITPYEHASHHGRSTCYFNYGANLSLWDRLHGTYLGVNRIPSDLGITAKGSLIEKLFLPLTLEKKNK